MDSFVERLDQLFVDDGPELESPIGLEELAGLLSALEPQLLAVCTERGHLVAATQSERQSPLSWREIRDKITTGLRPESDQRHAPNWRLADAETGPDAEPLLLLGWLGRVPTSLPASQMAALTVAGRTVLRNVALARTGEDAQRRLEHLKNQHEVLQSSHRENLAELLAQREENARREQEYVKNLEAEVERRSRALREALVQAEMANDAKSAFLANVSHEVRTPMTAILGYVDLLRDSDVDPDELREYVAIIEENSQTLLRLIDDLLDVSQIETDSVSLEKSTFYLSNLLQGVLESTREKAHEKGLTITSAWIGDEDFPVRADAARLRQAILNLVDNAIKFTEKGSVQIQGQFRSLSGADFVIVDVKDTGIGMTREQADGLFETFTQADSSATRKFGGAGLGLPIARNLAQAMGGDVTCRSELGRGSNFRITVRIDRAPEDETAPTAAKVPSAHADDFDLHELVEEFLAEVPARFDAIVTSLDQDDGAAAVELANQLAQEADAAGYPLLATSLGELAALGVGRPSTDVPQVATIRALLPRLSVM